MALKRVHLPVWVRWSLESSLVCVCGSNRRKPNHPSNWIERVFSGEFSIEIIWVGSRRVGFGLGLVERICEEPIRRLVFLPHMEVLYINVLVWCSLTLAPEEETFLGGGFFDRDILDSESEDNSPDHTQSHFNIAVNNFFGTNWNQSDALWLDKVKSLVNIGNFVESHLASVWFWETFTRDNFQKQHKFKTISEINIDGFDTSASFSQMRVTPGGEGLK